MLMKKLLHSFMQALACCLIRKTVLSVFTSLFIIHGSYGQVVITKGGTPYLQDFNTLASTGTSNTWSGNVTLEGWYVTLGSSSIATYLTDNGNSSSSNVYSYGSTGSTERAFGVIANSTSSTTRFGLRFKNNTGKQITSFKIFYRGEQWREGSSTSPTGNATTITFGYRVGTNLTDPSYDDYPSLWNSVPDLTFAAPKLSGTAGPLNGNTAGNYTDKSATVTATVNNGEEIMFRWVKAGATGSHGLAIDDVRIIPITNEPLVLCSQTSLSFNDTQIGNSTTLTLSAERIGLKGSPTLTMQSGAASAFSVTPATLPQTNGTTTVNVTFTPTASATYNDILIISGGGLAEAVHIALNGKGTSSGGGSDPELTVNPKTLTFPATLKGATSAPQNVTVSVDEIFSHNITYSLSDNENFSLNATQFNATTGGILSVAFTPKSYTSPKTAQLTITSGLLSETVTLTGTVSAPTLSAIPTTVYIANGSANIPITASNLGDLITITSSNPSFYPDKATLPATTTSDAVNIVFTGTSDASTTITISTPGVTTIERTTTVYGKANVVVGWNFQTETDVNSKLGHPQNQNVLFSKSENNTGALICDGTTASVLTTQWVYAAGTDKYWQTGAINTTGFKDLTIESKQASQMQGPGDWKIQYKIGSEAWTDLPGAIIELNDVSLTPYGPFNLPAACNNVEELYLRWIVTTNTSLLGGNIGASQTSSISELFLKGVAGDTPPPVYYTVTIPAPVNGTVTVMNGTTPVASGAVLESGTVLTLTANANAGYMFDKWWDNNTNATRSYELQSNVTISATFAEITGPPTLTHTVDYSTGDQNSSNVWLFLPVYGSFMDKGLHHTQTIYTENKLQPLVGSRITKISYKVASNSWYNPQSFNWQTEGTIKLMNTTATNVRYDFVNLSAISPVSVCYGEFKYQNYIMEFPFETPFVYQGGHLLVDIMKTSPTGAGVGELISFLGGATCFADDPNNQAWKENPDNFVSRVHVVINSNETHLEPHHRFPEITFTYQPYNYHVISATTTTGGTISPSGGVAVEAGSNQTFTFTPNAGSYISQVLIDGVNNPAAVSAGNYTFTNVTASHTIHVEFVTAQYNITASVLGGNGTITPNGTITVSHGDNATFTFTPDAGYKVSQVLVNGVNNPTAATNGSYTFMNVSSSHTIQAIFAVRTYTITPSVTGGNGTIAPNQPVELNLGENQTFTFTPNAGYKIAQVLIDGVNNPTAVTNGYYAFENVNNDHTIAVSFEILTYTITASVNGGNGTITPNGVTTVNYGGEKNYSIASNENYRIQKLLIDGTEWADAVNERYYMYTFENVMANHTIEVFFYIPSGMLTITASVNGGNGTITPNGAVMLMSGESQTFTITPNAGYEISQVLIDGVNNPAAVSAGTYTFTNVTTNHTIEASFAAIIYTYTVTINQPTNGTIDVEDITNGAVIQSGAAVAQGTKLEISVLAHENYVLQSILINNTLFSQTSPATFTMGNEAIVISANIQVGVNEPLFSGVNVYTQQNRVYIVNESNIQLKSIRVIDLLGRTIYEESVNSSMVFTVEAATGTYMVKLMSEEGKMATTKVYLTNN